jgi:hypothetical protein
MSSSKGKPSLIATGPGVRMMADLISCMRPLCHGTDGRPAGTGGDVFGAEMLAAPGTDDDFRVAADDFQRVGQDAVTGQR